MKGKVLLIFLNVVLLGALGFFYLQKDQAAPEIVLEETQLVYEVGMEESRLMEGVLAYDNQDGDITEYVVIEKIVTDHQKESATITYGVADASGNIGKATRTVDMIVEEEEEIVSDSEEENLSENEEELQTGAENNNAAENEPQAETDSVSGQNNNGGTNNSQAAAGNGSSQNSGNRENSTSNSTTTNKKPETNKPAAQTNNKPQNNAGAAQTSNKTNEGAPSLKLRQTSVRTNAGSNPAWVNVIEGCYDDKDDYVTLLGTLQVHGNYDKNTPGTYHVQITVTDTNGNSSAAYPLEIIVD